jgi:calcineurin-like phosphoesterase family protein
MSPNIFFTSDHHFNHDNKQGGVIAFCNRPFSNLDEMREELIARHNSRVRKGDLVYIIGDMFWRTIDPREAIEITERLNGEKYYIRGNHEEAIDENPELRDHFVWIRERATIHPTGYPYIVLDHFAGRVWNKSHKGAWQLYGHSHAGLSKSVAGTTHEESPLSMDIGVDTNNFYPWSIDEIAVELQARNERWERIKMQCPNCNHQFIATSVGEHKCAQCGSVMTMYITKFTGSGL